MRSFDKSPLYRQTGEVIWLWGHLRDFERDGILDEEPAELLARMALMALALHNVQGEFHPLEVVDLLQFSGEQLGKRSAMLSAPPFSGASPSTMPNQIKPALPRITLVVEN